MGPGCVVVVIGALPPSSQTIDQENAERSSGLDEPPKTAQTCQSAAFSIVISSYPLFTRKDEPMRYTLLLHYPEMTAEDLGEEALAEGMAAFDSYAKALEDAGVLMSAEVLAPSTATTTISRETGELLVQDGPF